VNRIAKSNVPVLAVTLLAVVGFGFVAQAGLSPDTSKPTCSLQATTDPPGCAKCVAANKTCGCDKAGKVTSTPAKLTPKVAEATLSPGALAVLIQAKVPLVILDARGEKAFNVKHIPGAKPLRVGSPDEVVRKAVASKDALIVTYCANTQCPASKMLAGQLRKLGFANVIELPEGIAGWTALNQKAAAVTPEAN